MSNIDPVPNEIIDIRKSLCGECSCSIDVSSPCVSCPKYKWGRYMICDESNTEMPSFPDMVTNIAKASLMETKAIFIGVPAISEQTAQERLNICKACEFFEPDKERCSKCGCYLSIKTAWRSQKCPVDKW